MSALSFDHLSTLTGHSYGTFDRPCPVCGPERQSVANRKRPVLRIWRDADDFLRYRCARCDAQGYAREDGQPKATRQPIERQMTPAPDDKVRTERALSLWHEAKPIQGTPADAYLRSRHVPYEGEALRWHQACPFAGERLGCMLALVLNIETDRPQAIHRTAINLDGKKLTDKGSNGRLTLGPIGGGAVKLTAHSDLGRSLGVGEGIETALAIRNLPNLQNLSVWSLLAANQMAVFPLIKGIESVWIAVDNDQNETGQKAARKVASTWMASQEAYFLKPRRIGADLNDLARAA